MKKRIFLTLITLAIGMLCLSCVSPFYGTARIKPGWHMDAGVAAGAFTGFTMNSIDGYYIGPRADVEIGYAFSYFFKFHVRAGGGWGWEVREYEHGPFPIPYAPTLDAAIGMQAALPHQHATPALRIELGTGGLVSSFMWGIGETEWLTLGCRMYVFPRDLGEFNSPTFAPFAGIHPTRQLSIFATPGVFIPYEGYAPLFSVGVGYKIK